MNQNQNYHQIKILILIKPHQIQARLTLMIGNLNTAMMA